MNVPEFFIEPYTSQPTADTSGKKGPVPTSPLGSAVFYHTQVSNCLFDVFTYVYICVIIDTVTCFDRSCAFTLYGWALINSRIPKREGENDV